jgi:hypothetical protein
LLPSEQTNGQNASAIHGKQGANGVELGCEDFEHDKGKRELADGGADIGALECPLGSSDLDHLGRREDDGAGAVHAQMVRVGGMAAFKHGGQAVVRCADELSRHTDGVGWGEMALQAS